MDFRYRLVRKIALLHITLLATVCVVAARESDWAYPPAAEVKAAFLKLLDRPKVPLDAKMRSSESDADGRVVETLSIASERKADGTVERVPLLIVRPGKSGDSAKGGRLPAVIVLHGTGGNKKGMRPLLDELAQRGLIGVALDARYHGERSHGSAGSKAYVAAITRAWRTPAGQPLEHPFYYDTCWDIWRTIDYLQTRADVDPDRLGMIGFSMGGIETWLAAAVDDRIKVAVPAIGVQSFRWSLEHDAWQGRARTIQGAHSAAAEDLKEPQVNEHVCRELWNKVIPGMLDQFDCPSMLRLFAGRPLLILNGELDPNCPLGGAKLAFAAAEAAYRDAGATEKLKILVAPKTGHRVTPDQRQAALDWLSKWLTRE
jgi:dienelactone hydrolase